MAVLVIGMEDLFEEEVCPEEDNDRPDSSTDSSK